jgi:ribonuclease HI
MSIVAISSKEQGLSRYTETDDLAEILALRAG